MFLVGCIVLGSVGTALFYKYLYDVESRARYRAEQDLENVNKEG